MNRELLSCLLLVSLLLALAAVASQADPRTDKENSASQTFVDVKQFGAVGDGRADDTQAIQRAVDSGGGAIVFPPGRYRLTETINIDLDSHGPISINGQGAATLVMNGPGPALRLVGTLGGTAAPHTVKEDIWTNQRSPLVDALEVVGDHPQADGIEVLGTMQAVLSRLTVRRAGDGIRLTKRNRNVIISECHVYENRGAGILLDQLNLHQVNIAGCHVSYNGGGGIVVRRSEIRNLQIAACDIEGNMDSDGPATANVLIDTREGSVREGAVIGCTIQHTHEAKDSANVRLLGRSMQEPQKVGHFAIADNAMSDVAVNIHLRHARGVTISGNTLWKGFEHNLLIQGSSNLTLGGLFDRNPDYRPSDSKNTLLLEDCHDCTLTGLHVNNTLRGEAGLTLRRCRDINIDGCSLLDCDGAGLLLEEVQHVRVSDCTIRDTREGSAERIALRLTSGQGNMIVDNLLRGVVKIAPGTAHVEGNYDGK